MPNNDDAKRKAQRFLLAETLGCAALIVLVVIAVFIARATLGSGP